jgi:uncharacterized surface protein with fasciclin (FAS1) repeats
LLTLLLLAVGTTTALATDNDLNSPDAPNVATLNIAHFAPFATEPISTSVSVVVSSDTLTPTTVVSDFVFGERVLGAALPPDTYTVEIIPTGSITPALTFTATVEDGVDYTVAAIGGANGWPLEPYVLINDSTPLTETGKVRITHLAPFAATSEGTEVDICTDDVNPVPGLTGIPYKASTGYLPLPAGLYDLNIAVAGTDCATVALDLPAFALRVGQVADIFAIGLVGEAGVPLQVVVDGLTARIAVGHFAPFASQPISTSVSVKLAGSEVLTDFVFSELTSYIDVAPGDYLVEIIPTGSITPAITGTAVISAFTDFTLAAIGNGSLQPLELLRLEDDNLTVPPTGTARIRVTHVAPFAASLSATSVDLCVEGSDTPVISALEYKESAIINLPAGLYDTFVAAAGSDCATRIFDIPFISVEAGQIAYIYAVGDVENILPGVVVTPNIVAPRKLLTTISNQAAVELPTIPELAASAGNFTTLLAALEAAGLDTVLAGPGPFTVFAPTDEAFAALPDGTVEALLADPSGALTQILLYHVVGSRVQASDLYDGLQLGMLNGTTTVTIGGTPVTVRINDAQVTVADLYASNGIVHVIDAVLVPPAP